MRLRSFDSLCHVSLCSLFLVAGEGMDRDYAHENHFPRTGLGRKGARSKTHGVVALATTLVTPSPVS